MLGGRLGVERSRSVPQINACLLEMVKGSALYVSEKKHGSWSKVWRGQIVLVVQSKAGEETDGEKNLMLLRRVEEEWTSIVLKT